MNSLNPYELREIDRGYEFKTATGLTYEIYFFRSTFFDHIPQFNVPVLELGLSQIGESTANYGLLDSRIGDTVAFLLFNALKDKSNAVVYVCDCSDSREELRQKKFHRWFERFNNDEIVRLEGAIDAGGYTVFNGLFVHKNHPEYTFILDSFRMLNDPTIWKLQ